MLAEQTSRSVQAIDLVMTELQERFDGLGLRSVEEFRARADNLDMHYLLRERVARLPQADVIALIDANGEGINSSRNFPPTKFNVTDRDYFVHFSDGAKHGMFISELLLNRVSGHKTVFFSKRLSARMDASSASSWSASSSPISSTSTIRSPRCTISRCLFLRKDGTILVRYPEIANTSVTRMPANSPWYGVVADGGGSYSTAGIFDNGPRLVSAQPLRDYPLVVNVAVSAIRRSRIGAAARP